MTLDPQLQGLLAQMAENPAPKLSALPVADARALYMAMSQMLDTQGLAIGKTEDMAVKGPAGDVPVRVYTPVAAGSSGLPALVYFHGGGFVIGDLNTHDALCRALANETGGRVIAVDYRLAPETKFPGAVEDAFAALKWVEANASDLGIDPNRIAVAGDSAGGNLSAAVAQLARGAGGPRLVFQLLIYPWLDMAAETQSRKAFAEGYFLETETLDWFAAQYAPAGDFADPRCSPARAGDLSGLPPALVITAGFDPLKDEGRAYADAMRAAGVDVTYRDYPGMVHGFFNMTGVLDEARAAVKDAAKALKAAFG